MPRRRQILANNETYHVVNRGVASMPIFNNFRDYQRFIDLIDYYRFDGKKMSYSNYLKLEDTHRQQYLSLLKKKNEQRLRIHSYCLMPNHFHLLVTQIKSKGIEGTLSNILNAYVKYFNAKNIRVGPLFQSRFYAILIENDELLLHVSRYIHLNPVTGYIVNRNEIRSYKWSSYPEYLGLRKPEFTDTSHVLGLIGGVSKYRKFIMDQVEYQRELDKIKHLTLEY